jgi:hypothetical protein
VMFGSREAMMATLHGDMQQFINSLTYWSSNTQVVLKK